MVTICLLLFVLSPFSIVETASRKFPDGFKWGAATSAYQIEGAWNSSGKGISFWDNIAHNHPEILQNNDNGDIACDSYHKYKEDVAMLKELGVNFYRFSLSWPRILPNGFNNKINPDGVNYYNNLINLLLENDIQPFVTLYHWDTPISYESYGYWTNPLMIKQFGDYARLAFQLFGDRVKMWSTFNEPRSFCVDTPTLILSKINQDFISGIYVYLCGHTVIKAHAEAYHIYNNEFRETQKGKITMVISMDWPAPLTNSTEDEEAAERFRLFWFGQFAHPIVYGNYPDVMIERIAYRSNLEGFNESRLPKFSSEESLFIKGTYDFLAINHYTTWLISPATEAEIDEYPTNEKDIKVVKQQDPSWNGTLSNKIVPWGLREQLKWVKKTYGDKEILISENGFPDYGGLEDDTRIKYYQEYLNETLNAIVKDGVNVTGYTAWSLMDNFEWAFGYTWKFGLYSVDFDNPERPRTPKASVKYFKKVVETNSVHF